MFYFAVKRLRIQPNIILFAFGVQKVKEGVRTYFTVSSFLRVSESTTVVLCCFGRHALSVIDQHFLERSTSTLTVRPLLCPKLIMQCTVYRSSLSLQQIKPKGLSDYKINLNFLVQFAVKIFLR